MTDSGLSCEAHVTWVQLHDPNRGAEDAACQYVAEQFPQNLCGQLCNPATCTAVTEQFFPDTSLLMNTPSPTTPAAATTQVIGTGPPTDAPSAPSAVAVANQVASTSPPIATPSASPLAPIPAPFVSSPIPATSNQGLGDNVMIFDPTMSTAAIQAAFDTLFNKQVNNEMGAERYGMYFMPGTYGTVDDPLAILIGYYTEIAGLGASPNDVTINGKIEVYNRCFAASPYDDGQFIPSSADNGGVCFALNNFWRTLSNLSINIVQRASVDQCRRTAMFWAISQASSMRRVDIRGGDVSLMDYCTST